MAEFTSTDLLNELARLLRPSTSPERDGGLLSPVEIHAQIIEIAKTVFLLNPGAIFYLAKIVRNSLYSLLRQELAVAEDMMVAVDNLENPIEAGLIGAVGPAELANASTAILALDAAGTVQDRPELDRFSRIIDRFTGILRNNVVGVGGNLRLPASEARKVIRTNLAALQPLHTSLLQVIANVRFIVDNYNALDIPTQVSRTSLLRIRAELLNLKSIIETSSSATNDANSRLYLLRSLASKVVAELLAQFQVAGFNPIVTSDADGAALVGSAAPPEGPFLLQAAGEGIPGQAATEPGPWVLDELDSGTLSFRIDGGPQVDVDLTVIQGPGLHGRNPAPYAQTQLNPLPTWPGPPPFGSGSPGPNDPPPPPLEDYLPKQNLHLVLDSNVYQLRSQQWGVVLSRSPQLFRDVFNTGNGAPTFEEGGLIETLIGGVSVQSQLPANPRTAFDDDLNEDLFYNDYYNTVIAQPPVKLGFKHLGTTIFFALPQPESSVSPAFSPGSGFAGWNVDGQNTLEDSSEMENLEDRRYTHIFRPRVIMELAWLKNVVLTHVSDLRYTAAAGTFLPHYVGFYVRVGNDPSSPRYEIVEVISDTEALIDTRNAAAGAAATSPAVTALFGSRSTNTQFTFAPDLLADTNDVADTQTDAGLLEHSEENNGPRGPFNIGDTVEITVGPTLKTTAMHELAGGTITAALSSLRSTSNGQHASNTYAHASFFCIFREQAGFNDKITIQTRSRFLSEELAIAANFFQAQPNLQPPTGGSGEFEIFPGPFPIKVIEGSGHEVFGFDVAQKVDPSLDPFLSVDELDAVVRDAMDSDTTQVEIVDTDMLLGFLNVVAQSNTLVEANGDDLQALGIGFGFLIELVDGNNANTYFILNAAGPILTVQLLPTTNSRGFVGNEQNVSYRIFTRRLVIASANAGPGSSVEIVAAPSQLGFPAGIQHGTTPSVQAVNEDGDVLDMSGLSPGDQSDNMVVDGVSEDGSTVSIVGGVSAGTINLRFAFDSRTRRLLADMIDKLGTVVESRQLLQKHNFDLNLNALDAAASPLLAPGATFQANINQMRQLLADLIAVLTQTPLRQADYKTQIPVVTPAIEQTIIPYDAPRVLALDALLDSLNEHSFDRALQLLVTGDLAGFFSTTHETASFAGALMASARDARDDLPTTSQLTGTVEEEETTLSNLVETTDPDENFEQEQVDVQ